jgi:hypothetical protein
VGSCCWPHSSRAHFTGDPGLAGPWVLDKLGIPTEELGDRSCKDGIAQCIRSLYPRPEGLNVTHIFSWTQGASEVPEGLGFPRITGKKGSRRWRSMKIWGNTLKLAAYQKRRRATDISGN